MKKHFLLSTFLVLLSSGLLYSQEDFINKVEDTLAVDIDLFDLKKPLELTLKFDIKSYQKTKYKDIKIPAEITYRFNDTIEKTKTVRIQARGAFRKQHCSLPPFWLNIKKAGVENKKLSTTNKIKLVNHCNGFSTYNNYVLREYLTYRLYNTLTPYSFRVCLVKMKYIDTGRKNKVTEAWAFMIEPEEMMAERQGAFVIKLDKIGLAHTDTVATDRVTLFEYMVGNADYSIVGRHNIKLLKMADINKPNPIPVPYDFDYSGLVNTSYALPGEDLGLKNVRERYYLGACRTEEQYKDALELFKDGKEAIFSEISNFEYLDDAQKEDMIKYIEEFYTAIEYEWFIRRELKSTCR